MSKKRKIGEYGQSLNCPVASLSSNVRLTRLSQDYDEDDDGFLFTRAKTRKVRASIPKAAPASAPIVAEPQPNPSDESRHAGGLGDLGELAKKKKRNKMSFSTPNVREEKQVRRSKRLSDEHDQREGSPQHKARRKAIIEPAPTAKVQSQTHDQPSTREKTPAVPTYVIAGEEPSATRIALPFADTPVIRRNKEMREGKSGKGERRSSLGLRGRRASSLIDSGNSTGK
jgi:kinetochore protein Mis13/DSN1